MLLRNKGNVLRHGAYEHGAAQSSLLEAMDLYEKAKQGMERIHKTNEKEYGDILHCMVITFGVLENTRKSLEMAQRAQDAYGDARARNSADYANLLKSKGQTLMQQGDLTLALESFKNSKLIFENNDETNNPWYFNLLVTMGELCLQIESNAKSKGEAIKLWKEAKAGLVRIGMHDCKGSAAALTYQRVDDLLRKHGVVK